MIYKIQYLLLFVGHDRRDGTGRLVVYVVQRQFPGDTEDGVFDDTRFVKREVTLKYVHELRQISATSLGDHRQHILLAHRVIGEYPRG